MLSTSTLFSWGNNLFIFKPLFISYFIIYQNTYLIATVFCFFLFRFLKLILLSFICLTVKPYAGKIIFVFLATFIPHQLEISEQLLRAHTHTHTHTYTHKRQKRHSSLILDFNGNAVSFTTKYGVGFGDFSNLKWE